MLNDIRLVWFNISPNSTTVATYNQQSDMMDGCLKVKDTFPLSLDGRTTVERRCLDRQLE